jgi:16S rRNA (guanine527-N7)-methyltransferase
VTAVHPRLIETLRDAQRFGFFGSRPIDEAVDHARWFVEALVPFGPPDRLVDLGSGGGLPGLVVADAFPETSVLLLDRRQKRTDFLELAVRRLGWSHVEVRCGDVDELLAEVAAAELPRFDAVTARGFGPPEFTLRSAVGLCAAGGSIVISEPPAGDRWDPRLMTELGVRGERVGAVRRFRFAAP